MFEKKASTSVPINNLLAQRWSGRAYDPDKVVEAQAVTALLEAARWAPSCYGDEPWRFIVCNKQTNPEAWQKAFDCLVEGNQSWAADAQILMLGVADTVLSKNGKPNRWGEFDTGAATMSLSVQAAELGLMVHQMGGYNPQEARKAFNIPEQFTTLSMISIGYQLPIEKMSEQQKEREMTQRQRNPLEDRFYDGDWDTPVNIS